MIRMVSKFIKSSQIDLMFMLVVLVISVVTRIFNASVLPAALTHDELVYAAQAKALALTGKTIDQTDGIISLQPLHPMYAELLGRLMVPFYWLFNSPILQSRALSLIFGILLPFILSAFSQEVFKNKTIARLTLVVALFNPLLWQMSRLNYDAVSFVFFVMAGSVIWLHFRRPRWMIISGLLMFFGFFQYQGYKLLFPFWILLLSLLELNTFSIESIKKYPSHMGRSRGLVLVFMLALFISYLILILPNQKVEDRGKLLLYANHDFLASQVNNQRLTTINNQFMTVFTNKATVLLDSVDSNFIEAFNTATLFDHGEPAKSKFAAWGHGWFYYIDLICLGFGLIYVGKNKQITKNALLLLGFILIGTLPALVNNGSWNLLRMFWSNVLLVIFIALGLTQIGQKKSVAFGILIIYTFFIIRFGYYYFYRYPILGNNTSYLAERVVTDYIERVRKLNPAIPITVYTVDPPVMTWSYIVYGSYYSKATKNEFASQISEQDIVINNITFTGRCVDLNKPGLIIAESWRGECDGASTTKIKKLTIPSIIDNGSYFHLYGDLICDSKTAGQYVHINSMSDFNISHQTNEVFCKTWLSAVD